MKETEAARIFREINALLMENGFYVEASNLRVASNEILLAVSSQNDATDKREVALGYLDTVMRSGDEDMRRGAYNKVSLYIKGAFEYV